ncbi:MAG: response regulator [Bacteroidetes bacterium]|nr:response regulator [Bacteroidota bacterium]
MNTLMVLVAEADPLDRWKIGADLEKLGLSCEFIQIEDESLEIIQDKHFDMILVDTDATKVDVSYILNKLKDRTKQSLKKIPVIALTADKDEDHLNSLKEKGFNDFLFKPLDIDELKSKIAGIFPHVIHLSGDAKDEDQKPEMSEGTVYSLDYLEEYANGDMDFVHEMVQYFITETPKVIKELLKLYNKGDWDNVKMEAHKFSPQLAIMGLYGGVSLLEEIERNAKTGKNLQEIPEFIHGVEEICLTAIQKMKSDLVDKNKKIIRVLVCEDDHMMLKLIEHKMASEGYEIVLAKDGKNASELLKKNDYDLIITDLLMPYMTGLELITLVRSKLSKNIPIIVLSRIGLENTVLKAFELGADDYIVKPFSPNELLIRAKKLLSKKK